MDINEDKKAFCKLQNQPVPENDLCLKYISKKTFIMTYIKTECKTCKHNLKGGTYE